MGIESAGIDPLLEGGALEQAMDSSSSGPPAEPKTCLNCGTPLTDKFCPHCGQKDMPMRQTLGELITNFVSSIWSYESKFIQTTRYLLFKPGFLAVEYTSGKRETYYHPARMYVFISFVFFLLFFSLPEEESKPKIVKDSTGKMDTTATLKAIRENLDPEDSAAAKFLSKDFLDSIKRAKPKTRNKMNFNLMDSEYESIRAYDSTQAALPEEKRHGKITQLFVRRGIELTDKWKKDSEGFGKAFKKSYTENLPNVFFFLLPIFALLLKLLYIRRDFYYSEHLVFSIYYYNFSYLAGSIALLVGYVPIIGSLAMPAYFIWGAIYFFQGMRRMYKQSFAKTGVKYLAFGLMFSVCLLLGILLNLLVALFKV